MKMPGEILPLMLSTGLGKGVLAGVVTGVCFLVFNGYAWSRRVKRGEKLRSEVRVLCSRCSSLTSEVCSSCSLPLCNNCSSSRHGTIRCQACFNDRLVFTRELKSGNSFLNYLRDTVSFGYWSGSEDNLNRFKVSGAVGAGKSDADVKKKEDESRQVRDFLQKLAENLTGGSLDEVPVNKMYQHPEYDRMFRRFHGPLCSAIARLSVCLRNTSSNLPVTAGQTVTESHAKLQNLIQRVIEEALKLPAFLDYSGLERNSDGKLPQFSPQTYEDLLTTAILNKVIDKFQQDVKRSNGASSSGVHSGSSSPGNSGRGRRRKHVKRDASPSPSPDQSSLEPMSQEEYGNSDSSGHVTDTPKEVYGLDKSAYSSDDEEPYKSYNNPVDGALSNMNFKNNSRISFPEYGGDIVQIDECHLPRKSFNGDHDSELNGNLTGSGDIYANNNSWEENWLFQKKKIKSSQSGPVPMVIPNSNTEYRALIGDRDVEDTTDLSDVGSDAEEALDIKQVLVNSKTIIGGKNPDILVLVNEDENNNEPVTKDIAIDNNAEVEYRKPKKIDTDDQFFFDDTNCSEITRTTRRALSRFLSSNLESDDTDVESYNSLNYIKPPATVKEELDNSKVQYVEATNLDVVDRKEDNGPEINSYQQEGEYTETVATPVQRHTDSLKRQHNIQDNDDDAHDLDDAEPPPLPPTPVPILRKSESIEENFLEFVPYVVDEKIALVDTDVQIPEPDEEIVLRNKIIDDPAVVVVPEESEIINALDNDLPGSIAEREHKKWLNPVHMENNPYSPEAIQNRLQNQKRSSVFDLITKSPAEMLEIKSNRDPDADYTRYGRDYYINEAKASTGGRNLKKGQSVQSDQTPLVRTSSRDIVQHDTTNIIMDDIYIASPAMAEDIDNQFDEIYEKATKYDDVDQDIFVLPVSSDQENIQELLKLTGGVMLRDGENLDYSDSFSSLDDVQRVYNIGSGEVIRKIIEKEQLQNVNKKYPNATELIHEEVAELPSVKELARMFFAQAKTNEPVMKPNRRGSQDVAESINMNKSGAKPMHMHSLTARSISKEFREGLKSSMPTAANPHPGGSRSVPDGIDKLAKEGKSEDEVENEVPTPGSIKTKLIYFEKIAKQ